MTEIAKQIEDLKVVPVVAIESVDDAERLADALTAGGIPCAEITLRTEAGLAAIKALSSRTDFLVGAGTVNNAAQAAAVADAGAKFLVAPGFNPNTVKWCVDNNMPVFPGTSSPTDLEMALEFGLDVVKFFPAEAMGGVKMLKAFHGPYPFDSIYANGRRIACQPAGLLEPSLRHRLRRKLDGKIRLDCRRQIRRNHTHGCRHGQARPGFPLQHACLIRQGRHDPDACPKGQQSKPNVQC